MEGTMNTIQKTTIIATAALALGAWGTVAAQEQTSDGQQTTVQQREQTVTQQQQKTTVQQQQKIAVQQREQTAVQQQQKTTVQQRTMTGDPTGEQTPAAAKGHTRQLGPGDGTGNQGVPPADGTGFGSPGRLGSGSQQGVAGKAAGKQAGKGAAKSSGSSTGSLQRRARSFAGSGPGGTLCDGSRRHSTMGAAGLGGFGRPRAGHR
jgi:hypothetical protein